MFQAIPTNPTFTPESTLQLQSQGNPRSSLIDKFMYSYIYILFIYMHITCKDTYILKFVSQSLSFDIFEVPAIDVRCAAPSPLAAFRAVLVRRVPQKHTDIELCAGCIDTLMRFERKFSKCLPFKIHKKSGLLIRAVQQG